MKQIKDDLISIIEEDDPEAAIPTILPMMPLRDVVVFTDMLLPLFVGREKSVNAIEEAISKDRYLFVVTQIDPGIEKPKTEQIYKVGTVSRILRMLKLPDGRVKALVQGIAKARIVNYVRKRSVFRVKIEIIEEPDFSEIDLETEAADAQCAGIFRKDPHLARGVHQRGGVHSRKHRRSRPIGRPGGLQPSLENRRRPRTSLKSSILSSG